MSLADRTPPQEARRWLRRAIGGPELDGWLALSFRHRGAGHDWNTVGVPAGDRDELARTIEQHSRHGEVRLGLALRNVGDLAAVERAHCLWVELRNRGGFTRLRDFHKPPTIVLRYEDTDTRIAIWALEQPATPQVLEAANRRLASELGADRKAADPTHAIVPPGAFFRRRQRIPAEVQLVAARRVTYHVDDVARGLPPALLRDAA